MKYEIGVWSNRRRQYFKMHHHVLYYNMLTQCKPYSHLADIEQQVQNVYDGLADELSE